MKRDRRFDRFIIIVLDGVGIGPQGDSGDYGDDDADSLGHVALETGVELPNLCELGLARVKPGVGLCPDGRAVSGFYGRLTMSAAGKDSISGHWELAGLVLAEPFPVFPRGFPREFISDFEKAVGRRVIGNRPASGTEIIEELGSEHLSTGALIVYTSADSVFQIAAHNCVIPEEELYGYCEKARGMLTGDLAVARVIARPFEGEPGGFRRTAGRRDFSLAPTGPTVLDLISGAGYEVRTVGKVDRLFAGRGITRAVRASGNDEVTERTIEELGADFAGVLFANFNDTDTVYGHRNDPRGYAGALRAFDRAVPAIKGILKRGDVLIITSDHGNDPTTAGTDHTREQVPLVGWYPGWAGERDLGTRRTLADVGWTAAAALLSGSEAAPRGFFDEIVS